jgi:hypothetical protein
MLRDEIERRRYARNLDAQTYREHRLFTEPAAGLPPSRVASGYRGG